MKQHPHDLPACIAALTPRTLGHQFVIYSDACSGVPEAPHERTFAAVNAVVRRLDPQPEFIVFPGDEIVGLTADRDRLRAQWRHWLEQEMGWLDRTEVPLWHTTGNHTTYDAVSERVFTEVLSHLPRNGPAGQEGLSYWVRRGDLFLVFVNTLWSGLGGEGHVEAVWLKGVLRENADARHKLVVGHHHATDDGGGQCRAHGPALINGRDVIDPYARCWRPTLAQLQHHAFGSKRAPRCAGHDASARLDKLVVELKQGKIDGEFVAKVKIVRPGREGAHDGQCCLGERPDGVDDDSRLAVRKRVDDLVDRACHDDPSFAIDRLG